MPDFSTDPHTLLMQYPEIGPQATAPFKEKKDWEFAQDWSNADTARQLAYYLFHGADWGQTRYIARHPQFKETNPILGERPSIGKVNNYFLATGLAHALLMATLPPEARKWAQYGTIGIEAGQVRRNKINYGIGMDF